MATPAPATLYSLGGIVQWIDESLNAMLLGGVAGNVERLTSAIWLPLEICVTISLMTYGWLIAAQAIPTPFGQGIVRIFKVIVIVAILEAGGFYQTQIMGAMLALPDEVMSAVAGEPVVARDVLAEFHNSGLQTATQLEERAPSILTQIGRSILFSIVSVFITGIYTVVTIVGLLMMLVAKVGMALIVMVGPLFIAFYAFENTKKYFEFWKEQAIYYGLYAALFSLTFGLVMSMLGYVQNILLGMSSAPEINIFQIMAAILLVCIVSIFLFKLPVAVNQKITGGRSISMPIVGEI